MTKKTAEKTDAKSAETAQWFSAVQGYRAFKSADLTAYQTQGELTICALRKVDYAVAEKSANGKVVLMRKGAQGWALMSGALTANKGGLQAGKFILKIEKSDKLFSTLADCATFIAKEGENAETVLGKAGKGLKGIFGSKYSFISDGKRIWRHESGTNKRGAAYFSKTF